MNATETTYWGEATKIVGLIFPTFDLNEFIFETTSEDIVGLLAINPQGRNVLVVSEKLLSENISVLGGLVAHESANRTQLHMIDREKTWAYSMDLQRLYDLGLDPEEEMKRQIEIKYKYEVKNGLLVNMMSRKFHVDTVAIEKMRLHDLDLTGYLRFVEINEQMDEERILCPIRKELTRIAYDLRKINVRMCIKGNLNPKKFSNIFRQQFLCLFEDKGITLDVEI